MLLVIDVGNTNIVAGVFDDKELVCHWRFSTDRSKTADEYGILLRSMFNYTRMPMDQIKAIHYFQRCTAADRTALPYVRALF